MIANMNPITNMIHANKNAPAMISAIHTNSSISIANKVIIHSLLQLHVHLSPVVVHKNAHIIFFIIACFVK